MVTIKDVARAAGVSVTTVSHAVNRTRHVNPGTIEKVKATIEQLGYQPSGVARALKSNRTHTVGMIVTSSTNPFFAEVIRGVETGCFDRGYSLMLCNSGDVAQKLTAYLRTLMMKRIDALLVMTSNASSDFFRRLEQIRTVPIIALDTTIPRVDCLINDDSLLGGRLAGAHLAGKGFARIGCITGPAEHPRSAERLTGFTAALSEAGKPLDPRLMIESDLTVGGGHAAMAALLDRCGANRPDAIFCFNDLVAIGAMCAAQQRGLRVPENLAVIGYDDIDIAAFTSPPLTTIRQPAYDIGVKAAELLVGLLDHGRPLPPTLALEPVLVERLSVTPATNPGRSA